MGALPIALSYGIYWLADRKLPNHLFVYIFLNAFFGGALAMAATGLGGTLLLQLSGVYPPAYLYHDYLPYFILMAWSEAVTTGMAITLMAVYRRTVGQHVRRQALSAAQIGHHTAKRR